MAHYAFLDGDNMVTEVIVGVDESDLIEGDDPETWYGTFRGQRCRRTSYNTRAGQHVYGGSPYRYNYASPGWLFSDAPEWAAQGGAFIPPQPFPSWVLNPDTALWDAPVPMPAEGGPWSWDEDTTSWVEVPALI